MSEAAVVILLNQPARICAVRTKQAAREPNWICESSDTMSEISHAHLGVITYNLLTDCTVD